MLFQEIPIIIFECGWSNEQQFVCPEQPGRLAAHLVLQHRARTPVKQHKCLLHLLLPQMAQLEDSFGGENWSSYSGQDGAQGPPVLASDFGRAPNLTKSCRTAAAAL
ncbi:hypothetical protein PCASD_07192 [Puccinia coronata f. sp. avenae]|uniref:Uncharacterized protein n=1 Tax=Puccinia coronata f. sp. avenae TaxID=200324 RepID=A0A2N5SUV7_9BASI|nr:hypothetical protein PCASD_19363 [Puccinia coronata f. sp. avenae]PLW41455.1 hypothetical protein PCASD_07192 [Puccinia coronata f. sp. avenae]